MTDTYAFLTITVSSLPTKFWNELPHQRKRTNQGKATRIGDRKPKNDLYETAQQPERADKNETNCPRLKLKFELHLNAMSGSRIESQYHSKEFELTT